MAKKCFIFLVGYPWLIGLIVVVLSIFFAFQIQRNLLDQGRLEIDSSLKPFISRGSGVYEEFKRIRREFGNEDVLVVALQPSEGHGLDLDFFQTVDSLTRKIPALHPQLESVVSLTNTPQLSGTCAGKSYFHQVDVGGICVSVLEKYAHELACLQGRKEAPAPAAGKAGGPSESEDNLAASLNEDPEEPPPAPGSAEEEAALATSLDEDMDKPEAPAAAAPAEEGAPAATGLICTPDIYQKTEGRIRAEAEAKVALALRNLSTDPLIRKDLIAEDGRTGALLIQLGSASDSGGDALQEALALAFSQATTPELRIAYAGQSRQAYESSRLILRDIKVILPVSVVLIILVLAFFFKNVQGVVVPLTIVLTGILWTAGIFALLGDVVNVVTIACPPILISVGSAYVIFFINQYNTEAQASGVSKRQVIENTIGRVTVPLGVTALTTVAGFAALMVSPIPAIQQLGFYAGVGVIIIIIFALTLAPAMLLLFPIPKALREGSRNWLLDKFLARLADLMRSRSKDVTKAWIVVGLVMGIGAFSVTIDSTSSNFKESAPIMQDLRLIEDNLAGTASLRIVFRADPASDGLLTAKIMYGIRDLKLWLLADGGDSGIDGIEGLRMDKFYSPVEYLDVYRQGLDGLTDGEVERFFKTLKARGGPNFLSRNQQLLQVTARMKITGSTAFLQLRELLDKKVPEFLPGLEVIYTGGGVLLSESADNIARGQVQSVGLALVIIFVILSTLFLSWKMGIVALYPNLVALAIFFGTLGWLGIPIGVTISVIASIALGIGVDDTIHFLAHYNEIVKKTRDKRTASQLALRHVAKPMVFTTTALALGFVVFVLSDMESQVLFGALLAYTLCACLATDVTFLPSVVMETKLITVWDYLGLKFNKEFVQGIGLFHNMKVREAKIATLMAYTQELEEGEILFNAGEVGAELFVVLEGKVGIYLEDNQNGRRTDLAQLGKGLTFGEMGLFRRCTRMASVQALEATKLLVISEDTLIRLQQRYPKIAAILFLNLSRSLTDAIRNIDNRIAGQVFQDGEVGGITDLSAVTGTDEEGGPKFTSIFQNMADAERARFVQICGTEHFRRGSTVFTTGEEGDYLLIVTQGRFSVHIEKDGAEMVIAEIGELDLIGEMAMLSEDKIRHATVKAMVDSQALYLDEQTLIRIVYKNKRLAAQFTHNMVCMLSDRLESTNIKLQVLT